MKNIFLIFLLTQWVRVSIAQNCPSTSNITTPSIGSTLVQAAQTITAASTVTTSGNDTATYRAGESVTLNPGFETFIANNARFKAEIGSCLSMSHTYHIDTSVLHCGQSTCMPVILTAPIVNGTGWTLEIDFDTTQIRPSTHTLGRIVTGGAMSTFVNNGKLILSIYLTTAANVQGNIGDTLICLGWESVKTNIPPNTFAAIAGTVETNTLLGTTTAPVQSHMKLESNNRLYVWVSYQGTRPLTHNNIVNQTQVWTGTTPNGMNLQGILSNVGLYLLNTATDTLVQAKRQSLPSLGIPVIQGIDAALVFKVIARNPSYRPTVAAILSMDVNGDGRITAGDITDIQRRAVGIYATGFPQIGTNDTISSRHFPQTWLTTHKAYRLSATYPKWDSVGCAREFVPKIDTVFKIDSFYRNRCDTAFLDVAMLMLGDADGNYNGDTLSHQRFGRQSTATMNYEVCNNVKNNILYIKVYADKNLTGGDWILQNSPLTLLGAEVADSKTTLMTANLVGNNLYVTASAVSGDIPARTPLFYLKVPASEKERIKILSDLGNLTGYWNASVADNVMQFCTPVSGTDEPSPIRLYPNPTSNGFVTIEHLDKTPEKIQVYNALGQFMSNIEPKQETTLLDLTPYAEGIYFVKIDNQTFKVVKK
jgi:Secretion system C-terminal sorting domain